MGTAEGWWTPAVLCAMLPVCTGAPQSEACADGPPPGLGCFPPQAPWALTPQGPRKSARQVVEGVSSLGRYKRPCVFMSLILPVTVWRAVATLHPVLRCRCCAWAKMEAPNPGGLTVLGKKRGLLQLPFGSCVPLARAPVSVVNSLYFIFSYGSSK